MMYSQHDLREKAVEAFREISSALPLNCCTGSMWFLDVNPTETAIVFDYHWRNSDTETFQPARCRVVLRAK